MSASTGVTHRTRRAVARVRTRGRIGGWALAGDRVQSRERTPRFFSCPFDDAPLKTFLLPSWNRTLAIGLALMAFAPGCEEPLEVREDVVVTALEQHNGNLFDALRSVAQTELSQDKKSIVELSLGVDIMRTQNVTDAGIKHLAGLSELRLLDLKDTQVTDAGMASLAGLKNLEVLDLLNTHVGDAGLAHLEGLSKLEMLSLDGTNVTDAGLPHLAGLSKLKWLYLSNTGVTDAGLAHLQNLKQLEWLFLSDTQMTDQGLESLHGLTNLQTLYILNTKVTEEGIAKLKQAIPGLSVYGPGPLDLRQTTVKPQRAEKAP
jgi:hypothetical protein